MSVGVLHYQNTLGTWGPVRLILLAILNARFDDFFFLAGLVCSSYVTVSMGTHYRAPWFPLGREDIPFVDEGNRMTCRSVASKNTCSNMANSPMTILWDKTIKNKSNQDWLCETLGLGNQSFLQNITMWIIPRLSQIKPWSCPNTGFQYMILSTATALFTNKLCIDVPKDFRLLVLVAVMDEFHLVKPIILCYQRWHHGSLSWGWPWKDFFPDKRV